MGSPVERSIQPVLVAYPKNLLRCKFVTSQVVEWTSYNNIRMDTEKDQMHSKTEKENENFVTSSQMGKNACLFTQSENDLLKQNWNIELQL